VADRLGQDERMPLAIEDYALIGDCHTAALVGIDGSIDWLCLPRFDSPSTFGALLGDEDHGRWLIAPIEDATSVHRRYLGDSFVLETTWETPTGVVTVTDSMPLADRRADVVRQIRGVSGSVRMRQALTIRFGYATALPWIRRTRVSGEDVLVATAGPDTVAVRGGGMLRAVGKAHEAEFEVRAGERVDVTMVWYPSHREVPPPFNLDAAVQRTVGWWQEWADRSECHGAYADNIRRSLLVLRALTHEDTGGIVAAVTTSLPESFGGVRNWDYRYCWLRDAALTLDALLSHGYRDEAHDWRRWLLRAIAGDPEDVQIMYGVAGERWLDERVLDSLPGYRGASPVRIGNGAVDQYQADVFGEVMVALDDARRAGVEETAFSWPLQRALLGYLEANWHRMDKGIWEIRGPERHFTYSRVMIWAAFDRGVTTVREAGLEGPADRWAAIRDELRAEIEEHGFDSSRGTYTQYYGSTGVDAALLALPTVGYLGYDDPRMLGTVAAIEDELIRDGLVMRYRTETGVDGLPGDEHPFLACSFWLVGQYAHSGRLDDATSLMDRLLTFCNDVGLLSEEYDVEGRRQAGNTPQAFSHLALVRAADAIVSATKGATS
jgi:GH15 family glucan-1,4-alpha-glucosidase